MDKPVLRFDRSDQTGAFVLVQVARNGTRTLDVKFIGTEGSSPYVLALRQNRVGDLKIKNAPCTDEEWVSIMERLVRQEPQRDIDASATVQEGRTLTITVRKRVGDITQRLGTISLHQKDEEIELFDWCGASVQTLFRGKEDLAALNSRVVELQSTIKELQAQLDEFIEAKNNDEAAWLEKFRDLLNEKKVRIREQQKIIDSAPSRQEVEEEAVEAEPVPEPEPAPKKGRRGAAAKASKAKAEPAKKAATTRKAGPSRPGKRKTRGSAPTVHDESEDEEGDAASPEPAPLAAGAGGQMDVDDAETASEEEDHFAAEERETTDEDATASEDDDLEQQPVRRTRGGSKSSPPPPTRKPPARSAKATTPQPEPPANTSAAKEQEKEGPPPPKRALPFGGAKAKAKAPPPPADEETESDDEL